MPNFDPLLLKPSSGGGKPLPGDGQGILTANAVQVIGFTVSGVSLIVMSRFLPTFTVFLTGAILLGVGLTHSDEITVLLDRFASATGVKNG